MGDWGGLFAHYFACFVGIKHSDGWETKQKLFCKPDLQVLEDG